MRVVRFYVSLPVSSFLLPPFLPGRQLQALDRSVPRQTLTATSGSKCSPPDLHRKLRIKVFPAGPQPQRTSEDIPDRMPEKNVRIDARIECQIDCRIACQNVKPEHMAERMPDRMPNKMSEYMPDRMSE